MQTALFVAILLVVVSVPLLMPFVPTTDAATLQLVTENGNVFSIDFDEILNIWSGYNSTSTSFNSTTQQQIQQLVNSAITNSTSQQDIDDLEMQIEDLITQLNTNSTATDVLIDSLQDRIDMLTEQLNSAIVNSTATETEIDVLQTTIDTLTEELGELETDLTDKLENIDGVGAGALGASGRVVTIPLQGLLAYGNHTSYDTSGTINPSTLFAKPPGLVDWVTLIQDNDPYVEYDIPSFGEAYLFDSVTQDLKSVIAGDKVYVTRYKTLDGPAQIAFDAEGLVVSEGGLVLLQIDNDGLGAGVAVDFTVPVGSDVKFVSSPNNLYNSRYSSSYGFVVDAAGITSTVTKEHYNTQSYTSGGQCRENSFVVCVPDPSPYNIYLRGEFYKTKQIVGSSTLDAYVTDVANSWQNSNMHIHGGYGQPGTCYPCRYWSGYVSEPVETPSITSSYHGDGLYHITGIIAQQQSAWFSPSGANYQIMYLAPTGSWQITDDDPWVQRSHITGNTQHTLSPQSNNIYLVIDTAGGEVQIRGDIISAATGIANIRGLPPDTPWSINLGDTVVDVGMTDSHGNVLVPPVARDDVTVPRHVNYTSAPNTLIPDFRTVYDTLTVSDYGITNEIELTVVLSSSTSTSEIVLIAPDGEMYAAKRSGTSFSSPYYVTVPNVDINGVWTIGVKGGSSAITLQEWTLVFKTADSSLVTGMTGTGNQYAVTVDTSGSGAYRLGIADTHGIRDSSNNFLDDSLQTGPDETHDAGSGNACPGSGFHVCSIERHNPTTERVSTGTVEYLVTFNEPADNVDVSDFVSLRLITTLAPRVQNTAFDVWHEDEQATPATSGVYVSSINTITSAKLILNASSPNGQYMNDWSVNLTAPGGRTMVITDASTSRLNNTGGSHEYYLGEVIGWNPPNSNWVLSVIDETQHDDDPTGIDSDTTDPEIDDPEGQITNWSLEFEHSGTTSSLGSVNTVTQDGIDGDQYVVRVTGLYYNYNGYMLWLNGDNDISLKHGSAVIDPRNEFAPNPHEGFNRGSVSIPSTPHIRGITVANSTSNSATFLVMFSENVLGADSSDFVVYEDGTPYGPTVITSNTDTPNVATPTAVGKIEEFITVSGYDDDNPTMVELGVNITHTAEEDLRFFLTAPSGTEKAVSFSASGEDLVQTSNEIDFGTASVNGEWTLRVEDYRDHVPVQKRAFLHEWTIKFVYQGEPTYDELQAIASQSGTDRAFAPLPEGQHSLRLYSGTLNVNPVQSPGVLFDVHNDNVIQFTPSDGDYSLFIANTYIRYPMTVDVNISDVRLSSQSDCGNALDLGIDKLYNAGDILMIPVLPGTTVLCMNIAGSDAVIHLGDVLAQSVVSSIPSAVSDSQRAISGAATFANRDGILTATITSAMTGSLSVERSLDYNDAYAHTGTVVLRNPPSFTIHSFMRTNAVSDITTSMDNRWDYTGTSRSQHFYGDRPTLTMNVYRNGELIETSTEVGPTSRLGSYRASNVEYYSMDQKISAQLGIIDLHEVVQIPVEKGDFVQVEITATDDISFALPPSRPPTGWVQDYVWPGYQHCPYHGVTPRPSTCYIGWNGVVELIPAPAAYFYLNPVYPDAKPVITSVESKSVEIIGGYVIFAGN